MRNMSFSLTTAQVLNGTKTVTRRLGWANLKPGERVQAVRKAMGLRKGEHPEKLAVLECVFNTPEQLTDIVEFPCRAAFESQREVALEGFPDLTPAQFVAMFCQHMKVTPQTTVNRIEFKYVDGGRKA